MLKIALQKKGRLHTDCLELLRACGLKFHYVDNALTCRCENFPIDLLFVRDDDIPTLVGDHVCDLGIVGENVLAERLTQVRASQSAAIILQSLGFSYCRLVIAVPQHDKYHTLSDLAGKRIATTYPGLLNQFLKRANVKVDILELSGSVEVAPRLQMADAICDLVATGRTLEENQLQEIFTVLQSQAVLIQTDKSLTNQALDLIALLQRRIQGVLSARESKYIMFHAPKGALKHLTALLPGAETPTILPLDSTSDKVAVHVVSREKIFWDTLEALKYAGASSILVLPIEKMLHDTE